MDQTPKPPTDDSSVFFIGEPGLVSMVVCAPVTMTCEQIATEVNTQNPTGIDSRWVVAGDADIDLTDVAAYPASCPDEAGRLHYILHC